jgi:Flp pilus assembly protein TadB
MILSYLAARYGRQIIGFIAKHGHPAVVAIIFTLIAAAAVVFYYWQGRENKKRYGRLASVSSEGTGSLVVQDNAQEGVVYVEPAIVIDES